MTAQQFLDWLVNKQNCENTVITGRNITGFSIKMRCRNTGRHYYFSGPFGHVQISAEDIKTICDELWINYPPEI